MKTILSFLIGIFIAITTNAQINEDVAKNTTYIGGGRQGLIFIKYERLLFYKDWAQTIANIGLGGIPGDHEPPNNIPRHNIITPEIGQLFGYKKLFIEIGLEPAIHFYGNKTYTDLNAIIGLRYQSRKKQSLFLEAGYIPKIFYTYKSDIDSPIYFAIGLNF